MRYTLLMLMAALSACATTPTDPWAKASDDYLIALMNEPMPEACMSDMDCQRYLAHQPGENRDTATEMAMQSACFKQLCSVLQGDWKRRTDSAANEYIRRQVERQNPTPLPDPHSACGPGGLDPDMSGCGSIKPKNAHGSAADAITR